MGLGKSLLLGMKVLGGGAMHSMAGSLAAGFVAGAGSSLISQGVAKGLGLQPRIDGKSALLAGLSTAASAGLLRTLGTSALAGQASEALDKVSPRSFS
ncbi:hypothetical protein, partial [Legionella fairfieldensis]|uniref:hypothetical protein n=1 Tax=Legionella fairfieldensis TaxID=45064 RepID=UPI001A94C1F1